MTDSGGRRGSCFRVGWLVCSEHQVRAKVFVDDPWGPSNKPIKSESMECVAQLSCRLVRDPPLDLLVVDGQCQGGAPDLLKILATVRGRRRRRVPEVVCLVPPGLGASSLAALLEAGARDCIDVSAEVHEMRRRLVAVLEESHPSLQREWQEVPEVAAYVTGFPGELLETLWRLGRSQDVHVLIRGETGVGKECAAEIIHYSARHEKRELVTINCAAVPEPLAESTFFGHQRGAFTGAIDHRRGLFDLADGNDLFLDEVATLSLSSQAKLLRVLSNGAYERLGSHEVRRSRFRVLSATNECLEDKIRRGEFRQDVYERIAMYEVYIPPLRERRESIAPLAREFLRRIAPQKEITSEALSILEGYPWPGNVRQLLQSIRTSALLSTSDLIGPKAIPRRILSGVASATMCRSIGDESVMGSWAEVEARAFRDYIAKLMHDDSCRSLRALARRTGLARSTLGQRLRMLGVSSLGRLGGLGSLGAVSKEECS